VELPVESAREHAEMLRKIGQVRPPGSRVNPRAARVQEHERIAVPNHVVPRREPAQVNSVCLAHLVCGFLSY
jgi:hypothetical protein